MKSILIATDLSARSDRALDRAVSLAREHGAALTVVHVVDDDLPAPIADAQKSAAEAAIRKHVDALIADDGPDVSIELVGERPHVGILETSVKTGAELIVLGAHREDTFADMFRGTTAERVVRAGDVPVLLVKDRVTGPYLRIMVGVDFSVCSRRAFEFSVGLAPSGRFHLVHAYDVPFKGFLYSRQTRNEVSTQHAAQFQEMVESEMATFLASQDGPSAQIEQIMEEGAARDVIYRQVRRLDPDLLVMGTHGRTGVALAALGSVAEDQLRAPPCDVLAVKAW